MFCSRRMNSSVDPVPSVGLDAFSFLVFFVFASLLPISG